MARHPNMPDNVDYNDTEAPWNKIAEPMQKVRMKVTITWTYEADPEAYGTDDPTEMAQMDLENGPFGLIDMGCDADDFSIIIEEAEINEL